MSYQFFVDVNTVFIIVFDLFSLGPEQEINIKKPYTRTDNQIKHKKSWVKKKQNKKQKNKNKNKNKKTKKQKNKYTHRHTHTKKKKHTQKVHAHKQ